jgi:hypothetical protein
MIMRGRSGGFVRRRNAPAQAAVAARLQPSDTPRVTA